MMDGYEIDQNRPSFRAVACPRCEYDGGWQGQALLVKDGDPPSLRTAVCRACGTVFNVPAKLPS